MSTPKPKPVLQSPLDIFNRVARFIEICTYLIGVEVLNPNWRFSIRTWITIVSGFLYYSSAGYTVWFMRDDILAVLEVICMNGLAFPGVFKLVQALTEYRSYYSLHKFGLKLFEDENVDGHPHRYRILLNGCIRHVSMVKRNVLLLAIGVAVFGLYPSYQYLRGGRPNVLPALIPMVDSTTESGYYVTVLFQLFSCFTGIVGIFSNDVFLMELISVYSLSTDLIGYNCKRLSAFTEENEESPHYRQLNFRNIIIQIQDLESFIQDTKSNFDHILSVQQLVGSASISLALFLIVSNQWYGGIGYVIFTYTQMLSMCILGSSIQENNHRLPISIYKTNWYQFPISQQKIMVNLMQCAYNEQPKEIWIVGLAPLNLETGTAITQKIYQIFMMMLSFLE